MQAEQQPDFPVVRFEAGSIQRFDSMKALNLGTEQTIQCDPLTVGMIVVDRNLLRFKVIGIESVRRSVNPKYWGAPRAMYVLRTRLGAPKQVSFEYAKALVIDRVITNGWHAQGGESAEEFRRAFEGFRSWREVVANISLYGKRMF